jgi:hypothetical protein
VITKVIVLVIVSKTKEVAEHAFVVASWRDSLVPVGFLVAAPPSLEMLAGREGAATQEHADETRYGNGLHLERYAGKLMVTVLRDVV